MKIFIEKPEIFRGIYRAFIFIDGKVFIGSSIKSYDDAVVQLKIADKIPSGWKDLLEEYKGGD